MRIFNYLLTFVILLPLFVEAKNSYKNDVELTPFISYRFGGDFDDVESKATLDLKENSGLGLITAWKYDNYRQGELLVSHYNTELKNSDISITYAHLGGNIKLSEGRAPFWFSGGIGLTHFSPRQKQYNNETKFSANVGINTKIPISKNTHLYIGGRVYGTFFDSKSRIFCDSTNCAISVETNVWIQSELMTGISVEF